MTDKDKFLKMDAKILIYIFNNLDKFLNLLGKLQKDYKEITRISLAWGLCEDFKNEVIIRNNKHIDKFFLELGTENRGRQIYLINIFLKNYEFKNRKDFLEYFVEQFEKNNYLDENRNLLDFDNVLEISFTYPNILQYCSSNVRREIMELHQIIEEN